MQFVSFKFLAFLIAALLLYYVTPDRIRKYILLFVNFLFYSSFGIRNLAVLYGMIGISYLLGEVIKRKQQKRVFIMSIIFSLLPLILFKYHVSLTEPIGISFFTFKIISYLADTYMGKMESTYCFRDYCIYVSFFSTVTSGPIDRPESFMKQICKPKIFQERVFVEGFLYVLWGYFQKMILADRLSAVVSTVYGDLERYQGFPTLVTTFLYTLQIYFDFAGYTYLAMGLGKMFGYTSVQNFKQPYFATSIRDFWQRWHISLSSWLRDYVYIPLGGNRKGKTRKQINLLLTFLISGIWHGTGWNFIVWGLLHGFYQVIGSMTAANREKCKQRLYIKGTKTEKCIQILITFLLVNVAWVFFRSTEGIGQSIYIIKSALRPTGISFWWLTEAGISKIECMYMIYAAFVIFAVDLLKEKKKNLITWYFARNVIIRYLILYVLLGSILLMGAYGPGFQEAAFIYFQF